MLNPGAPAMAFVRAAAEDAYDRLIFPSVEREMRSLLTEQADEGAIKMFGLNLKPLLMQPPVKGFVTMGLDPGYRNGCKVAVVAVSYTHLPFSGSIKAPAASSGAGPSAAWAKSSSARGSSPFSRATVARVRRFCL